MAKDTPAKAGARKPAKAKAAPGKKSTGRSKYDWEAIESEYRAGQLSNREIAKKFGPSETAIRKRASAEGWTRDLSDQVRKATKDKLVRSQVRTAHAREDDDKVVAEVSDRAVQIVESHRRDINDARDISALLFRELRDQTSNITLLEELVDQQADEEDWDVKRRSAVSRAISLPSRVGVLRDLANSMKVLQGLERTAFNIDEQPKEKDALDELLDSVSNSARGIDGYGG